MKQLQKKKVNFWIKNKEGNLMINKNHNWFYQIQGQLHITNRKQCLFAVWSGENERLKTEIIKKDDIFWENSMKVKLDSFYMNCLLPEIVDPRFTRNLSIREPYNTIKTNILKEQTKNISTPAEISHFISQNEYDNIQHEKDKSKVSLSSTIINKSQCQPSCSRYLCFDEF